MTDEDKLRFELDAAFNRISVKEIRKLSKTYAEIYNSIVDEYGYDGNSAIIEFCYMLRELYPEDEDFIQATIMLSSYDTFGWALNNIHDKEIYEYAKKKMIDVMKEEELDDDEINENLEYTELPN